VRCWSCGTEARGGEPCGACGRIQPFPHGLDHWQVLGLPRRLGLTRPEVETRVHELNRRLHPDYFRLRSPEEQAISLENSAAVNSAYRVLRDPVARVEYLLEREGLGLATATQGRPPADLFEELLEIQELRQELTGAAADEVSALRARLTAARTELETRRRATEAELTGHFPVCDAATDEARRRVLGRMRDALARRAYLRTVLRDLEAALDGDDDRGGQGKG
jgi:molecular chaperone HscB